MAHIPDGFLSASVSATTYAAAAALSAYAARRTRTRLDERAAPTLGLATAAVFAAQVVNFPVAAGTSGHLLGGTLVAVIFGPWAAFLVMTAVLIVQALIFADGGLTALGANVVNIAAIGALLGYGMYRALMALLGEGMRRRALAASLSAYAATVLTGVAAGLELGLSGVAPVRLSVGAMASVYAITGAVEGAITGLAVWALARKRPDLLYNVADAPIPASPRRAILLGGLGSLAALTGALSVVASTAPDRLDRLAVNLGFADAAAAWKNAPFAEYRAWLPGAGGTALAVAIGAVLVFVGAVAVARALMIMRRTRQS